MKYLKNHLIFAYHIKTNEVVEFEEIENFKDSLREYQITVNKYTPFIDLVLCTKLIQLGAYFDNQISKTLDFIKSNEKNIMKKLI